jgi:undecaprenyl-diphosphatase
MNIFQSIILGITEGATEFLPVSSSGHLIIVRKILSLPLSGSLAYDAVLQFASALALALYFWKDILLLIKTFFDLILGRSFVQKDKTMVWAIILGTIPAVIFGLLLQSYMDSVFRNVKLVGVALLLGSGLMYWAQTKSKIKNQNGKLGEGENTVWKGIKIGLYQCLALIPGVSRSGATISGGLLSGLSRDEAVRFSFLMSIPILLGSGAKELFSARHDLVNTGLLPLFFGSLASFVVALLAIHYFIRFLKNHNLNIFIYYRILIFLAIFLLF